MRRSRLARAAEMMQQNADTCPRCGKPNFTIELRWWEKNCAALARSQGADAREMMSLHAELVAIGSQLGTLCGSEDAQRIKEQLAAKIRARMIAEASDGADVYSTCGQPNYTRELLWIVQHTTQLARAGTPEAAELMADAQRITEIIAERGTLCGAEEALGIKERLATRARALMAEEGAQAS